MSRENRVIRFNDTRSNLRGRINSKLKFRFLGVINSQTFEEKSTESGSSAATERMEDENTLETVA